MFRRICFIFAIALLVVSGVRAAGVPRFNHVVIVILENHSPADIYGSTSAPYLNGTLIPAGAKFTDASTPPGMHPSQPNYIALFAGDNWGITSDTCPVALSASNLAQQLVAAGLSFAQYSEDLPGIGDTSCSSGLYVRKHNPTSDFAALPITMNLPYSQFTTDLNSASLPTVSFVVPNLCHDMEGSGFSPQCPAFITDLVSLSDTWLSNNLPAFFASNAARNGLLIVTWDEGSGLTSASDSIPMIFAGAHVQHGFSSAVAVTHYSVLRTLEDMYGLTPLANAASASPILDVWDDVIFADTFE